MRDRQGLFVSGGPASVRQLRRLTGRGGDGLANSLMVYEILTGSARP